MEIGWIKPEKALPMLLNRYKKEVTTYPSLYSTIHLRVSLLQQRDGPGHMKRGT